MKVFNALILFLLSLRTSSAIVTTDGPLFGMQTGPNDAPIYAGEVFYDQGFLYLTGESYVMDKNGPKDKSSCLVIGFDMNKTKIVKEEFYGLPDTTDVCGALTLSDSGHLLVLGNSEPDGWTLDFTIPDSATGATKLNGLLAVLNKDNLKPASSTTTGLVMTTQNVNENIPYPISVYSDRHGNVWVASLTSIDNASNTGNDDMSHYPNWLSDNLMEYGSSAYMTVSKYSYSNDPVDSVMGIDVGGTTLSADYSVEYPMDPTQNDGKTPTVFLADIFLKNNHPSATKKSDAQNTNHDFEFLIVAGSTRGISDGYGPGAPGDEDGFISYLNKDTGALLDVNSPEAANVQATSVRIGTFEDDILAGTCNDWSDPNAFFVVGATQGNFESALSDANAPTLAEKSLQGYVMKINVDTLKAAWIRQFPASAASGLSEAYALSCVVDEDNVYVTGNVEKSGSMYNAATEEQLSSYGGADVWTASMDKQTGSVNWMRQDGSSGDDRLAKRGSVDLTGEFLMIYGETNGDIFRQRSSDESTENTDLFMIAMEPDTGNHHRLEDDLKGPDIVDKEDDDTLDFEPRTAVGGFDYQPRGTQLEGDLFPGGMVYDSEANDVILTGGSYLGGSQTSMCFTASWDLESGLIRKVYHSGSPTTEEACNAIAWSPLEDMSYAVGFTEAHGMLEYMVNTDPNKDLKVIGAILQTDSKGEPVGAAVIQNENVQYPVAVVTHPSEDSIFVASSASDSTAQISTTEANPHPDLTTGGSRQFGVNFFVSVSKFDVFSQPEKGQDPLEATLGQAWEESFKVEDDAGVSLSGMVLADSDSNTLVLVGSTNGSGNVFGTKQTSDWDGFILKLDPSSGSKVADVTGERSSTRIDSSNHADDWINGICVDKFNPNDVFVVGGTKGKIRSLPDDSQLPEGDIHAFIAKIELETLGLVWIQHFTMQSGPGSTTAEAAAFSCTVAPGEDSRNAVYIAGTILDGAFLDGSVEGKSGGGDDIFVIQMDDDGGKVNWIRQIGTEGDDRLAASGGIAVDVEGNAIVYGETTGAFYSLEPSGKNDLVAFTMSMKDGSYHALGTGPAPIIEDGIEEPIPDADGDGMEDIAIVDPGEDDDDDDDDVDEEPDSVFAFQSGPDSGATYAGGMVYDSNSNAIYITGATYGSFDDDADYSSDFSSCFFGAMMLPSMRWKDRQVFGTNTTNEACSALALAHQKGHVALGIVGSTESGGLMTQGSDTSNSQYSMLIDVYQRKGKYNFVGGAIADDEPVQYPAVVVSNGQTMYVASMWSSDEKVTADYEKSSEEQPNFTSGGIEKFGSDFGVVLEEFNSKRKYKAVGNGSVQESYVRGWREELETVKMPSVFVSGLIAVQDDLVVVGSTTAGGDGPDMDGIMAKVKKSNGNLDNDSEKTIGYFTSVSRADDWIMNACEDTDSDQHFYIVGGTASRTPDSNTINAFAAKINVQTLAPEWVRELSVLHASGDISKRAAAIGLGCDVIPDTKKMYIAGTVENGAHLDYEGLSSAGGDDIFVAKLSSHNGEPDWINQVGSNGEDRLARGGGVKADENGNAVLYGDTNGDFFRWNPERIHDIFVMLVDKNTGYTQQPFKGAPFSVDTSAPREWFGKVEEKESATWVIVGVCLAIAALAIIFLRRRRQRKRSETQKSSIFAYLQKFDVEDVDLRKSPPGGWHGTYLNKLAYGINKSETAPYSDHYESFEARPLTSHSSVVSDSLFMDAASTPSLEYSDSPAAYDDLLDRYKDGSEGRPGMEII
eukprot:scaffold11571_cov122-Cylindrotheca_fusiformis.AAC.11